MKRKVKRYDSGGNVKTRSDDEIEWANSKPMGGAGQQYPGEGWKQREKEQGEKNLKAFKNFFGMKEAPKSVDLEPVGDANKSSSYNTRTKSEEAPTRKIEDYIKKSEPEEPYKPTGKTFLREEADIDEKPAKKVVAKKVVAKKVEPKASQDSGFPKDTKSTRMPSNSGSRFKGRSENPIQSTIDSATKTLDRRTNEQKMADRVRFVAEGRKKEKADELGYGIKKGGMVKKMASGGSVKSASARADGCAIRGKTRA
jgi:hypothetical protein